jgi:hypothetical protein
MPEKLRDRHDYLGRSTARGSLLLWMHHLKNITCSASFIPAGAPATETYKGEFSVTYRRIYRLTISHI